MFHQNITLPILIEKVNLSKVDLSEIFTQYNLCFNKILIITGKEHSYHIAKRLVKNNRNINFHVHNNCQNTLDEIEKLRLIVSSLKINLILGIGGGKVLDSAKLLSTKTKISYIAIPTLVTTDSLASPISIVNDGKNQKSFGASIPNGILLDYSILNKMTHYQTLSGIGDIISNQSALLDWDLAIEAGHEKPNNFARFLSEISISLINKYSDDFKNQKFIEDFIYAIITSGLAMNIAKSSRPCSGAEHLLAHAISELKLTDLSHGYVVGSLTDFCLYLHGKHYKNPQFSDAVINLLLDTSRFIQIIDLAKKIRGNRYTILNKFSNQELIDKLHKYIKNSNK